MSQICRKYTIDREWSRWPLAIPCVYQHLVGLGNSGCRCLFDINVEKSALGRAFIAIGRDQDLAEHMGINLLKYKNNCLCPQ